MQCYVALRAREACEGNAFPAGESVPKALQLVAAKFVSADQAATCFRKKESGSVVVNNLLMPASAAVLSDAAGRTNLKCLDWSLRNANVASASCASVSKQAIYACACLFKAGQYLRTSVIDHVSENHRNCLDVLIHPPMPTVSPSAIASATAMQRSTGDCRIARSWSCVKHESSQRSACLLSLRRRTSARAGLESLTHCGLCEGEVC